jgi:hypothetical protein
MDDDHANPAPRWLADDVSDWLGSIVWA